MRLATCLVILAACGPRAAPKAPAPIASSASASPAAAAAVSPWPVPMRVMTWTPDGVVQVGELPGAPPAAPPTTPWYVEPTRPLDEAALRRVVTAVRDERIPGLSLRGQPVARWLGELRDLPELRALILDDTETDGAALAAIGATPRRIYLARTAVDDAAITRLAERLPALEVLDLEDTAITDRVMPAIATLGELQALNVAGTRLTDAGGVLLGKLGKLAILDAGGTNVGARTVAAIRPLALRELFLDHTRAGKELATLAGYAPGIVRFDVSALQAYKPTDGDLAWLASAPFLVEAGLSGSTVHDPLVLAIAGAPRLRELRLAGTPITARAVQAIAKLDKLEEVDLAETPVDDASAAALVAMPNMRVLRLDRTPITDAALRVAPSPRLVELYVSRTAIGDAGMELLDRTPKLEGLGLGETKIGDITVARIAKLGELHTLVLGKVLTGRNVLAGLGKLRQLVRLYLDHTRLGDEQVAAFGQLRELRVLHLEGTDVSDESLPILRRMPLDELTIGDTRMSPAIADLAAWPRLRTLSVMGLDFTDDELPVLARRASLVTLDLSATEVKNPGVLERLPALRMLGLAQLNLSADGQAAVKALRARGVEVVP